MTKRETSEAVIEEHRKLPNDSPVTSRLVGLGFLVFDDLDGMKLYVNVYDARPTDDIFPDYSADLER